ncbi:MAG TPA: hypothetical protein VH442_07540, partial [Micromonosporaceae bacterium]
PTDRDPLTAGIIKRAQTRTGHLIAHTADVGGFPVYESRTRSLAVPRNVRSWLERLALDLEGLAPQDPGDAR